MLWVLTGVHLVMNQYSKRYPGSYYNGIYYYYLCPNSHHAINAVPLLHHCSVSTIVERLSFNQQHPWIANTELGLKS